MQRVGFRTEGTRGDFEHPRNAKPKESNIVLAVKRISDKK